ncbi:MAG: MFS transporter, partial [Sulfuritalea sp.]|nr:MFS transporter [Sulfuritalea sp.]
MKLPDSMRALGHRPFRLYFFGQGVSVLGSWIQQVALAWLVYRLTGSAALLGLSAFAALAPILLVGPLAGAWIDRHDRRRLLMGVQALLFIHAAVLATLTWFESIGPALIIFMSLTLGVLNAIDTPLRQSLIPAMVGGREDLPNALALNAMLFNLGRFIGSPIAGLLLGFTTEAACFLLNAFTYLALWWGVAVMRLDPQAKAHGSVGHVFKEGVRFAVDTWPIRTLLIVLALLNLTASAYAVLLPVFAKELFHGDAGTLGL